VAQKRTRPTEQPSEEQWADFSDLVLTISREIKFHGYSSEEAFSLSPSQGIVMRYVLRHPGSISSKVAHASGLQRSNLSTVLRSLEDLGLLERRSNSEDGREVEIYPTPLGLSNYAVVRKEWARLVSEAAGDTANIEPTLELLRTIETGLVQLRQNP
jgi:DNA-binding MarR family transcriptional regulator